MFFKGSYYHGHNFACPLFNSECPKWQEHIRKKEQKKSFCERLKTFYFREGIIFNWDYSELFDCAYKNHFKKELTFKNIYQYHDFLEKIYSGEFEGYLVLSGLSIKLSSRSDFHGFIPIKTDLSQKNWSPFTKNLSNNLSPVKNVVIGVHQTNELGIDIFVRGGGLDNLKYL